MDWMMHPDTVEPEASKRIFPISRCGYSELVALAIDEPSLYKILPQFEPIDDETVRKLCRNIQIERETPEKTAETRKVVEDTLVMYVCGER